MSGAGPEGTLAAIGEEPEAIATPRTRRHRRGRYVPAHVPAALYPLAAAVVVVFAWDACVRIFEIRPFILPPPLAVAEAIVGDYRLLLRDGFVTLQEAVAGFALSVVVGVPLALVLVGSPLARRLVYPLLVGSQAMPKVAIAPLFIIWLGFGLAPKILMAFLIAVFPIVVNTFVGLASIEVEKLYLTRSMGATQWQTFFKVRLPNALPSLFSGLKIAVTLAVTGAIVGEFIGADRGLGRLIVVANGNLDTPRLFAAVVVVAAMAIALFGIVHAIERFVVRWHPSQRLPHTGSP